MRFRDWRLGKKYGMGVAIVLLLMAGGYARSFRQLVDLKDDLESVSRNWMGRIIAVSNISRGVSDLRMVQLQYATASDTVMHSEQAEGLIALIDLINANRDTYEGLRQMEAAEAQFAQQEEALYAQFDRNWDRYQTFSLSVVEHTMAGKREEAVRLIASESVAVFDSMSASLIGLVKTNESYATNAADRAEENLGKLRHASLLLFLITVAVSIAITFWLVRLISRPVRQLADGAKRVADGDLTVQLPIASNDEVGQLGQAFNVMTGALREARDRAESQRASIEQAYRELQAALQELRETQDQLILQEKMASLGKLVAGVSHELNTPTGALLSSSDLTKRIVVRVQAIVDTLSGTCDPAVVAKLHSLTESLEGNASVTEQAGRRIQEIVASLRSFVRLDEAEYLTVDLHEGIESSLTLLGSDMLHRIEIVKDYGELPEVTCIPGQVNQVFYNILRNSVEAIDNRGAITICTRSLGDKVSVTIRDTGRGIAQSRLSQIYDVGWAASTERVRMGSGIMTAYNIVRAHKGEFTIESELGKGTLVTIVLPVTQQH